METKHSIRLTKKNKNKSNPSMNINIKEKQKTKYYLIDSRQDGHKIYLATTENKSNYNNRNNTENNNKRKSKLIPQKCIEIYLYNSEQEENRNECNSLNLMDELPKRNTSMKKSAKIENIPVKNLIKNFDDIIINKKYDENTVNSSKNKDSIKLTENILSTISDEKLNKTLQYLDEENFINSLKNQKRKTELLNAIQKYKRYKNIGNNQTEINPKKKNLTTKKQIKKNHNRINAKIDISDKTNTEKIQKDNNEFLIKKKFYPKKIEFGLNKKEYIEENEIKNTLSYKINDPPNIKNNSSPNYFNNEPIPINKSNSNGNYNITHCNTIHLNTQNLKNNKNLNTISNLLTQNKETKHINENVGRFFVKKLLREEKYYIGLDGKEKLLEVNQLLINDNNDESNNYTNSTNITNSIFDKMSYSNIKNNNRQRRTYVNTVNKNNYLQKQLSGHSEKNKEINQTNTNNLSRVNGYKKAENNHSYYEIKNIIKSKNKIFPPTYFNNNFSEKKIKSNYNSNNYIMNQIASENNKIIRNNNYLKIDNSAENKSFSINNRKECGKGYMNKSYKILCAKNINTDCIKKCCCQPIKNYNSRDCCNSAKYINIKRDNFISNKINI